MYKLKVEREIVLSKEDIEDLVSTALCGGIGYWAILDNSRPEYESQPEDECIDTWTAKILMDGGTVYLIDVEDHDEVWEFKLGNLLDGVKRFAEDGYDKYGAFGADVDLCNIDADCADTIVQLGLFGELVFG